MHLAALALTTAGGVLLGAALPPATRIVAEIPAGPVHGRWQLMRGLIVVFMVGYAAFALAPPVRHELFDQMLVPAIFFFGAVFVLLVTVLALDSVHVARRVSALEVESTTDPLMQIFNRRYLDRRLREEVARSTRYGLPFSVLLVDVDHFKQVNDRHGHAAGDRVLARLGSLLKKSLRECDVAARYGGEEVVGLAPNTGLEGAHVLAERLRRLVEASPAESGAPSVTVSIGLATLTRHMAGEHAHGALLAAADAALYDAKHAGRNRVCPPAGR